MNFIEPEICKSEWYLEEEDKDAIRLLLKVTGVDPKILEKDENIYEKLPVD